MYVYHPLMSCIFCTLLNILYRFLMDSLTGEHIGPLRETAPEVVRRLPPLRSALPVAAVGRALRALPRLIFPRRSCSLQVS